MKVLVIGCGQMGSAMARGLASTHELLLHSRDSKKADNLAEELGCRAVDLYSGLEEADWAILAIKPQNLADFSVFLRSEIPNPPVLLSLLVGISLSELARLLPQFPCVRLMPNLAVAQGSACLAVSIDPEPPAPSEQQLRELLEPCGKVFFLNEDQFDAFTPIGGSGPAFIATIIEAMTEAGILMGLHSSQSLEITLQTILGTINVIKEAGTHPGQLRWDVSSPAGTTIAGIRKMEETGLRSSVIETLLASFERVKAMQA